MWMIFVRDDDVSDTESISGASGKSASSLLSRSMGFHSVDSP